MKIAVTGAQLEQKMDFMEGLLNEGLKIISIDEIINELYQAGNAGYDEIKNHYGDDFLTPQTVDTVKLSEFFTTNPNEFTNMSEFMKPHIEKVLDNFPDLIIDLPTIKLSRMYQNKYDSVALFNLPLEDVKESIRKETPAQIPDEVINMLAVQFNDQSDVDFIIDGTKPTKELVDEFIRNYNLYVN